MQLKANEVEKYNLSPELRRLKGGSQTIVNVESEQVESIDLRDVICDVVVDSNVSLSAPLKHRDGVVLDSDSWLLLTGQDDKTENGVYVNLSDGLARAGVTLYVGMPVFIGKGQKYQSTVWQLQTPVKTFTVDTSPITFRNITDFKNYSGHIGQLDLRVNALENNYPAAAFPTWDKPILTIADMTDLLDGTKTEIGLYFSNEVYGGTIKNEVNAAANDSGYLTKFTAPYDGLYVVTIDLIWIITLTALYETAGINLKAWIDLYHRYDKTDNLIKQIGYDSHYYHYVDSPAYSITVTQDDLSFRNFAVIPVYMNKDEYIWMNLKAENFTPLVISEPPGPITSVQTNGYVSVKLAGCYPDKTINEYNYDGNTDT